MSRANAARVASLEKELKDVKSRLAAMEDYLKEFSTQVLSHLKIVDSTDQTTEDRSRAWSTVANPRSRVGSVAAPKSRGLSFVNQKVNGESLGVRSDYWNTAEDPNVAGRNSSMKTHPGDRMLCYPPPEEDDGNFGNEFEPTNLQKMGGYTNQMNTISMNENEVPQYELSREMATFFLNGEVQRARRDEKLRRQDLEVMDRQKTQQDKEKAEKKRLDLLYGRVNHKVIRQQKASMTGNFQNKVQEETTLLYPSCPLRVNTFVTPPIPEVTDMSVDT